MTPGVKTQRFYHYAFLTVVFLLGFAALADSLRTLDPGLLDFTNDLARSGWIVLALIVFVSSNYSVKVPALAATLSISEVFLFTLVIAYGSAPAVITVAIDGLVVSLIRRRRNPRHIVFNLAEPTLSMWVASKVFALLVNVAPFATSTGLARFGVPALVLCVVYFVMNSGLNTIAMSSESGESPFAVWRKFFLSVSLNYFGAGSIAVLVAMSAGAAGPGPGLNMRALPAVLLVVLPLVISSYFTFKMSMGRLEDENIHLAEMNQLYMKVVEALAMAVDAKDQVTHGHICRVQGYAISLAKSLNVTDSKELRAVEAAALLHDMGKLAIPEHILNKPGKLTSDEFDRMKLHATLGANMLSSVDFPYPVVPIVRHHHENWDGTGYPEGLQGDAIPIGARILSVVDCYDALRSHRPYRRALSPTEAMAIVKERRGTMYDPAVVDAFEAIRDSIEDEVVDEPLPEVFDQFSQAVREARSIDARLSTLPLEMRLSATDALLRLYEHLCALGPGAGVAATCDVVSEHFKRLAPAGLVVFYRRQGVGDELVVSYASGFGEALMKDLRMPVGHGVSGWVVANRRSILNADPALDVGSSLDGLTPRFQSTLSVPLTAGDDTNGAVTLYASQPLAFTDEQRVALELVSGAVAEAVERAHQRDEATGPGGGSPALRVGSGAMDAILDRDVLWRRTTSRHLGVLCVRTPDGDGVMDHASVAVSQATRVADLIFRPDDRELVVLMPDCDPGSGQMIIDRIAQAFPPAGVSAPGPLPLQVAFACSPHDGITVRQLLEVARRRLREGIAPEAPADQKGHADAAPAVKGGPQCQS